MTARSFLFLYSAVLLSADAGSAAPKAQNAACSLTVTDYGAAGDGRTLDTGAIQRAIDTCGRLGGGEVRFPRGIYRAGTVYLRSHVSLLVEEGAVLKGSESLSDYLAPAGPHIVGMTSSTRVFLYGDHIENVSIRGKGTIDGNRIVEQNGGRGPLSIIVQHSANIVLDGITVTHSPGWSVTFFDCRHVRILGVRLVNVMFDGINPVSCQDVLYDGVVIDGTGDDPITIKNEGPPLPGGYVTRDITVRNTIVRNTSHPGIKIGTGTAGTFSNIVVEDSAFETVGDLFAIQLMRPTRPGETERFIRNVSVRRVRAKNAGRFLDITAMRVDRPVISGLHFEDIQIDGKVVDSRILGTDVSPIKDVTIRNIVATSDRSSDTWLRMRNVSGVILDRVTLDAPHTKSLLTAGAGSGLTLSGVRVTKLLPEGPAIHLTDIQDAQIGPVKTSPLKNLVWVAGAGAAKIHLHGPEWPNVEYPLLAAADVADRALMPAAQAKVLSIAGSAKTKPNETLRVEARIQNAGAAGAIPLTLFASGRAIGRTWTWIGTATERIVDVSGGPLYVPGAYVLQLGKATRTVRVAKTAAQFRYGDYCEVEAPSAPGATTRIVVPIKNVGGSTGTHVVQLKAGNVTVASKKIVLRPGEEMSVPLEHVFPSGGLHVLQVADFPAWPFATFRNVPGRFLLYRDRLVIEAAGRAGERNEYATIYVKGVAGDFDAQVRVLSQSETGENAAVGLIQRNQLDDIRSGGFLIHYREPKYGGHKVWQGDSDGDGKLDMRSDGGDSALPVWYKLEKRGQTLRTFSSRDGQNWRICGYPGILEFRSLSIQRVQDVGIYGTAYNDRGELSRMEFSDFEVRPVGTAASRTGAGLEFR